MITYPFHIISPKIEVHIYPAQKMNFKHFLVPKRLFLLIECLILALFEKGSQREKCSKTRGFTFFRLDSKVSFYASQT